MKLYKIFFFNFIVLPFLNVSQSLNFNIKNAHLTPFNGNYYLAGIEDNINYCKIKVYKFKFPNKLIDSIEIKVDGQSNDYFQTASDTVHDFLNIYFQKKKSDKTSIIRLNKGFKITATIQNIDIQKVNNLLNFENEKNYFNHAYYAIKKSNDTSNAQFFLDKYILIDTLKNFEYKLAWQFPFERSNIEWAHIILLNKLYVFLFVKINNGLKKGEWILKIKTDSGTLIKGIKINNTPNQFTYCYGNCIFDSINQKLLVTGQMLPTKNFNIQANLNTLNTLSLSSQYIVEIDSSNEITNRAIFTFPIIQNKNNVSACFLHPNYLSLSTTNNILKIVYDSYFTIKNPLLYAYYNTLCVNFDLTQFSTDKKYTVQQTQFFTKLHEDQIKNKSVYENFINIESNNNLEKFCFLKEQSPIKLASVNLTDSTYLLLKHSNKDNSTINLSKILVDANKINEINILSFNQSELINLVISSNFAIIALNVNSFDTKLKIINWIKN
ncbi:MAG: hypothetical protein JSU07_09195 [Bacteroidetes bacterium]|nr:hypothetical protein [Bacteroidota bacterium]